MKKIISVLFISIFMLALAVPTFAAETTTPSTSDVTTISSSDEESIMPMADVLVWYYMTDGTYLYRRLWNETRGYWVSPEWILIGVSAS